MEARKCGLQSIGTAALAEYISGHCVNHCHSRLALVLLTVTLRLKDGDWRLLCLPDPTNWDAGIRVQVWRSWNYNTSTNGKSLSPFIDLSQSLFHEIMPLLIWLHANIHILPLSKFAAGHWWGGWKFIRVQLWASHGINSQLWSFWQFSLWKRIRATIYILGTLCHVQSQGTYDEGSGSEEEKATGRSAVTIWKHACGYKARLSRETLPKGAGMVA